MPNPTEARLALRSAAAGARDRLANRMDTILGLVGDGNGNTTVPGTSLIPFRTLTGGRVLLAHNPSGRVWTQGDLVEAIPLDDRAPIGYRVPGRPGHNFYAQLIWSSGTAYSDTSRVDEPWMINSGTGRMTPIGTHQFDPYTLETTKTSLISNWSPLAITNGDTSELYRMHDGTLYWRSRLSEASLVDGNIVYPFLLYHPDTGWIREEPNLRAVYGSEISNSDNGRGEALDVTDDGTVVFIDMASSTVTFLSDIKAVWRRQGGVPLTLWHTQRFGTIYQALPPDGVAWIDCIDAGSGPALVSSYGVFTVRSGTFYANLFQSDRLIQDRDTHGLNGGFFYDPVAGSNDVTSYISTWRADGSTYRLRDNFVSPSSREIRLYVGDGNLTWTVVNTFADEEPFIRSMFSQFGLAPYRDGVFGRRTRSGLSGPGNQFNAVNYYGPATVAGEPISTIWHVRIGATAVTRQAVVSVVTPSGETGRINGHAMSDGKLYFSTGAGRAAYVNAHIDPGIYEVDPVTYGVRQVCGMPPGLAAGGWGSIWGDRRSAPA